MKKTVFITGCSSGLGFSTVVELINKGYFVFATMRSLHQMDGLKKACNYSQNLRILQLDLSKDADIERAVNQTLKEVSKLDIIIHNAGSGLIGPVDSATPEEVQYLFDVNFFSILKITQKFLPILRKQHFGHILFVSSISGVESAAYQGVYASTQFALEAAASSWATTLHRWNIKVSILQPGAMNTELPQKVRTGSFYNNQKDNPYVEFNRNASNFLKEVLSQGTDPKIVACQICDILASKNPLLRYQTCDFSKNLVSKHLRDPSGNEWVNEHREFVEQFYRKL